MIIINYAVGRRSFCQWRSTETTKLCCCFSADDQFSKLKDVFLATGRGCRQDLPLVEVDNRLLVQLLLPKDEGSKTLDETAFFQQLLKPDLVKTVLLSRLRYLWSTDWRSCLEVSHFQNFHLFTAMAAASSDVKKWKRNLTQEMSTEPNDESEPDEPEFETSFRFQQEGDIVAVYNVEDFQQSHQDHQWGRGNSQFLGEGGSKDGVAMLWRLHSNLLRSCVCQESATCTFIIVSRDVRSLLNLAGIYLADIKHSDAIYSEITCRPCQLTPITAL